MKTYLLSPIVGAIMAISLVPAAHANLFTNASFESPLVPVGGFTNFGTGSTGITGWTVVGPQASVVSGVFTQNGISFPAQSGNQWLDLTGFNTNTIEGVTQTVGTTPGTMYTLSFWVGNIVNPGGIFGTTSTVDVSINGGPSLAFTNSGGAGTASLNWAQFTTSFTASSASTILTFLNGDPANDNSNGLDNIVLNPTGTTSVPEPATLTLLGMGLFGVVASRRRKPG